MSSRRLWDKGQVKLVEFQQAPAQTRLLTQEEHLSALEREAARRGAGGPQ